ncbi:hypothetical protein EGJ27_00875 [Pseudomonas sp. v388]|uniref:hypothetical protein n=1 Tax=Pseudomonas sp. v388 TaxID=2479849 RepID=UPI000F7A6A5C|nr:hypothetical protein [Pseudomonas sp. v388]RRV10216.1 hypothetical protein EGJ27_00875 [Pseudomonas sp. v388]
MQPAVVTAHSAAVIDSKFASPFDRTSSGTVIVAENRKESGLAISVFDPGLDASAPKKPGKCWALLFEPGCTLRKVEVLRLQQHFSKSTLFLHGAERCPLISSVNR